VNTKITQIQKRIATLKKQMLEVGAFRPGSISKQIRYKNGEPYGEYSHLSYTFDGKGRTIYIPAKFEKEVIAQTNNFRKFKQCYEKLIALNIQLSDLKIGRSD
jgi:hypothetical protein